MSTSNFDQFQFENNKELPVRAWLDHESGELHSTGIDWTDYRRMSTQQVHKPFFGRRSPVPHWALDDRKLRIVIIGYLLRRFCGGGPTSQRVKSRMDKLTTPENQQEVLVEIQQMAERRNEALLVIARRLSDEYVATKNAEYARKRNGHFVDRDVRLNQLRIELESIDACLRTNAMMAAKATALCYWYYRQGCDSVECGQRLQLTPMACRQILSRINRVANTIFSPQAQEAKLAPWKQNSAS